MHGGVVLLAAPLKPQELRWVPDGKHVRLHNACRPSGLTKDGDDLVALPRLQADYKKDFT